MRNLTALSSRRLRLTQCTRYFHYARLVIASFGLSRATDHNRVDLPAALARVSILVGHGVDIAHEGHQFQSTATHIIECFEFEFDNTGFTRGARGSPFVVSST